MNIKKYLSPEKSIISGILPIFLVGSLFHFTYEISGNNVIMGAFAPVNESIWEHLKMIPLPLLFWWGASFLIVGRKDHIDKNKWFTAALVAFVTALPAVPFLYYFYTGAFGVHYLIIDITILFVALLLGQLTGLHIYQHSKGIDSRPAMALSVCIVLLFVWFTFYPPRVPMFKDPINGTYGIRSDR